jgi:hypothetical protein
MQTSESLKKNIHVQGSVINPSRFQSSHTLANVGVSQNGNRNIGLPSIVDPSKDPDFHFFYGIKNCLIQYNSASLVQCLPTSALSDFHLYWLTSLATTKEEARGLVKHILSTYAMQVDPTIKSYYLQKIDRLLGKEAEVVEDTEEDSE